MDPDPLEGSSTKFYRKTNASESFRSLAAGRKDRSQLPNWGLVLSPLLLVPPPEVSEAAEVQGKGRREENLVTIIRSLD